LIHIFSFSLVINEIKGIPNGEVQIVIPGQEERSLKDLHNDSPILLPAGQIATIRVDMQYEKIESLMIRAGTQEVGIIQFHIQLQKQTLLNRIRSFFSSRERDEKVHLDNEIQSMDWEGLKRTYAEWFNGVSNRPLFLMQSWGQQFNEIIPIRAKGREFASLLDRQDKQLRSMHYHLEAYPKFWPNFGPGILASILGARQITTKDTAWFLPPEQRIPEIGFEPKYASWKAITSMTEMAVEKWGAKVAMGFTDLGGNLDILASLMSTENLLFALNDSPELVEKLTKQITELWLDCYRKLSAIILPQTHCSCCWGALLFPGAGYYLQSDFSYMISPKMFERFVMPDLDACCHAMEYPFYHLDGIGQIKHLDRLLAIPDLKGIQWVPGEGQSPADEWLELLSKIRKSGKNVQVGTTLQGAEKIIRALGGKGFCFEIEQYTSEKDAADFRNAHAEFFR
jgi:succinate dehydrogenase flavin-adding protein (antitoxin of CptAB toxin-antitoxin module)